MADKISVYVDQEMHRILKAEASLRGKSLSEFMVDAALSALHSPRRQESATKMDCVRESAKGYISSEEIRNMRNEGRQNE
ncbi:DUF1778 domain-containing protein [Dethiobacter alkaliphilus]|uniref:DUF1778 domain-containing protein n=1 Tax=Dethiobacter alkaliphilus TaxID=427926 RepID=UPI002225DBE3|nr:DUF1778 domain-containing protein [Dethiobacter alkaliphilus]MCW3488598.1 DUF1778 domain-containing protein [Dethiobacter alkaliphilus]